jgi:hypothetical protein
MSAAISTSGHRMKNAGAPRANPSATFVSSNCMASFLFWENGDGRDLLGSELFSLQQH